MIYEHEIPKGSRLYFGKLAKEKRKLENKICNILGECDFEEILTPNFSYSQHQSVENQRKLIKISDERNEMVSLRADSTLDVVRIITKRLGRTTKHKKWFYAQPIFSYPSCEEYQVGCEWINHDNISDIIELTVKILKELNIKPILQITNINISKKISKLFNIDIEYFKENNIAKLYELKIDWLEKLIKVKNIDALEKAIKDVPNELKSELELLLEKAKEIKYENIIISPIYYGSLKYYDGVYYKVFENNLTICRGGMYSSEGIKSLGFALYVDNLLKKMEE